MTHRWTVIALALLGLTLLGCRDRAEGEVGDRVEVGSLDLTVLAVERLDEGTYALFSEANTRVRVRARNERGKDGEIYRIAPFAAFRLDDDSGVGHDPRACGGCEDALEPLDLSPGGEVEAWVYFALAPHEEPVRLRYSAPLSNNRATISLD